MSQFSRTSNLASCALHIPPNTPDASDSRSSSSTSFNYEIHPLNVLEKMENAHGRGKNFALLRIVFGEEMPDDIVRKYKDLIAIHNETQINSRFPTVGFPIIIPNDTIFDRAFSTKSVDFHIKMEMWYRSNDSYDFCAFDILPNTDLIESPLMFQDTVIEVNYRGSLSLAFRQFPIGNLDEKWVLNKWSQPVKIYHPTRCLLYVLVEEDESMLTPTT